MKMTNKASFYLALYGWISTFLYALFILTYKAQISLYAYGFRPLYFSIPFPSYLNPQCSLSTLFSIAWLSPPPPSLCLSRPFRSIIQCLPIAPVTLIHGDVRVQQEPQMPESCTWALELFIGLQSLLLLPPSKHIRPQDTNNYMQLSVMIHSGPKAGITAWGEIALSAPLLGLSLRVRSSSEIWDREKQGKTEKQTDTNYRYSSSSTLHISLTRYFLAHRGDFAHKTTFTCSVEQLSQGQQTNSVFFSGWWLMPHMDIKFTQHSRFPQFSVRCSHWTKKMLLVNKKRQRL